jgi:AraC-like DNA-binding protein
VFGSRWLDHPVGGADPTTYAAILETQASIESRLQTPIAEQLRPAIHAMLFTGSASTAHLARPFNLSERTQQRRLEQEGLTARRLVGEGRWELSQYLLHDTDLPIREIAALLCYSDVSVFARAFRRWSGMSPGEGRWRATSAPRGDVAKKKIEPAVKPENVTPVCHRMRNADAASEEWRLSPRTRG